MTKSPDYLEAYVEIDCALLNLLPSLEEQMQMRYHELKKVYEEIKKLSTKNLTTVPLGVQPLHLKQGSGIITSKVERWHISTSR